MANFNLVVNTSNFKPFTYEEMARPLLLYKQEEEARQQAYLDLLEKASTLEDLAASEKDTEAYGAYLAYKNRLNEVVDAMAKNGLTRQNNQVFNLRKSYMNDIKPLNDLLMKRNKLIEEQRANNKDGTNIYSTDYGNMSLAEMKRNPTHTYNTLNGNVVRAISAETFAPLAKQILESPEYESILGKLYFQERIQRGYTLDQMINELQGTEAGSKLAQVKLNILSSLGMDKKGFSLEKQAQVEQFVNMGAMAALGETGYSNFQNREYLDSAHSYALELSKREDAFKYKHDDPDDPDKITGYNEEWLKGQSSPLKVDTTPTISLDNVKYTIEIKDKMKTVIRINDNGTREIVPSNSDIAARVRKQATGTYSISTESYVRMPGEESEQEYEQRLNPGELGGKGKEKKLNGGKRNNVPIG